MRLRSFLNRFVADSLQVRVRRFSTLSTTKAGAFGNENSEVYKRIQKMAGCDAIWHFALIRTIKITACARPEHGSGLRPEKVHSTWALQSLSKSSPKVRQRSMSTVSSFVINDLPFNQ
jgi:hypothetical protein